MFVVAWVWWWFYEVVCCHLNCWLVGALFKHEHLNIQKRKWILVAKELTYPPPKKNSINIFTWEGLQQQPTSLLCAGSRGLFWLVGCFSWMIFVWRKVDRSWGGGASYGSSFCHFQRCTMWWRYFGPRVQENIDIIFLSAFFMTSSSITEPQMVNFKLAWYSVVL